MWCRLMENCRGTAAVSGGDVIESAEDSEADTVDWYIVNKARLLMCCTGESFLVFTETTRTS